MSASFYTIPSDFDFLEMLARRVTHETADDPLSLKDYNIILPDRTACDLFKKKLHALNEGKPMIMPQVVTLESFDDDVLSLRIAAEENLVSEVMDLPPAVSHMERELYLTREILKHPETADSVATAVGLAQELANFIDELHTAAVPLEKLAQIDAGQFPGDLKKTRNILKIVTDIWPKIKKEKGVLDRIERREKVLNLLQQYSAKNKVKAPMIIGGFHRVSKGMTDLIGEMASGQDENVRIVFHGLDTEMGNSWKTIGTSHPQYAFKKLLYDIRVQREQISYWPGTTPSTHSLRAKERLKLLREAMRPSDTTHKWKNLTVFDKSRLRPSNKVVPKGSPLARKMAANDNQIDPIALTGMDLIVAGTPQEEASCIALKFREILERQGATATLITPDKALASRVIARLQYWNIKAASEDGVSLMESSIGRFMMHSANMAVNKLAPVPLLETLKSPYASLGKSTTDTRKNIDILENMTLRGPRPSPGFEGLKKSLTMAFNNVAARIKDEDKKATLQEEQKQVTSWLKRLERLTGEDYKILSSSTPIAFRELLSAHIRIMENFAKTHKASGADMLWCGKEGEVAQNLLKKLLRASDIMPPITGEDYLQILKSHLKNTHCETETHPRLRIVTPERAHLYRSDVNIVAGLTEANWPGKKAEKFWLSPELRSRLGLAPIETEIGYAAFDFVHGVSNKNVVMTRAERNASAPTVSSPFLTRLEMLLQGLGLENSLKPKSQIMEINAALHRPAKIASIEPPSPTPPEKHRPRRFSVSAVEMLLRDPYSVYARYVLKLYPKDTVDAPPNYAERGNIIHGALDEFKRQYPEQLPEKAEEKLIEIGRKAFDNRMDNPSVRAFWWPRFERMARWFIRYEQAREGLSRTLKTEVPGKLHLDTEKGHFLITAIADRIDEMMDDSLSIIDYKTGGVPTRKDVNNGMSPQLTLEALIAMSGGFEGIASKKVGMIEYWKLSGARPAGHVTQIDNIEELQAEALEGLTNLLLHFSNVENPYLPTPRPGLAPRYIPYNHLGRSDEWGHDTSKGQSGGRGRRESGKRNAPSNNKGAKS